MNLPHQQAVGIIQWSSAIFVQGLHLVQKHGTILSPECDWENNNLRDPFPIFHNDKLYLYYAGGREHGIGLAISTM